MSPRWTRKAGRPARMRRASAAASRLPSPVSPTAAKVKGSSPRRRGAEADHPAVAPSGRRSAVDGRALQAHHLEAAAARRRGPAGVAPPGARQLARSRRPRRPHDRRRRAAHARHVRPARREAPSQPPSPTVAPSAARTPLHLASLTRRRQPRARAGGRRAPTARGGCHGGEPRARRAARAPLGPDDPGIEPLERGAREGEERAGEQAASGTVSRASLAGGWRRHQVGDGLTAAPVWLRGRAP